MLLLVSGLLALQGVSITIGDAKQDTTRPRTAVEIRRDSIRAVRDSMREERRRRPVQRIPVTAEHVATAYSNQATRALMERARVTRLEHDSTLLAYDAKAFIRISAGLGFKRIGRDRLLFRHERAARVRWERAKGAMVEVTGSRTVIPIIGALGRDGQKEAAAEISSETGDISPIPYYPGRDALWVGHGMAKREVDEREIVHPLGVGAEAYYRYAIGDSIIYRLPDGKTIRLIEVQVTAREPRWNLVVGSFWFDASTAQLVRAAYRLAVPMDIVAVAEAESREEGHDDDDIPRWLQPMVFTLRGITVEYGLHEARWWLPRTQMAEGDVQISFMRAPFRLEESFRYASVNGRDTLPSFPELAVADSARGDTAAADSARRVARRSRTMVGDTVVQVSELYDGALRVVTRVPRDTAALARSSDLPPSAFDGGEDLFGRSEMDQLMSELDLGLQAGWSPQPPTIHYGIERGLLRYNRVEALSAGVGAEVVLGKGYTASGTARIGIGDWVPNAELGIRRSDGRRTLGANVYHRLAVSNDWGDPLGFGASVGALLFGRDEGLYYRSWGGELTATREGGALLTARLFAERHRDARAETDFSLAEVINDIRFRPNLDADEATVYGLGARLSASRGLDPHGWRLTTDVRAEGGTGRFDYARGLLDATVSHGLGPWLDGALTASAGWTGGRVPVQRLFFLGGTQTIRGQPLATAAGDAMWMARAEVGASTVGLRPVVFYDLGWAGARDDWRHPGTPLSGAGVGASLLDGLIRFDVARGIRPERGWRANLYLEARF
jgi:hypothetical protein